MRFFQTSALAILALASGTLSLPTPSEAAKPRCSASADTCFEFREPIEKDAFRRLACSADIVADITFKSDGCGQIIWNKVHEGQTLFHADEIYTVDRTCGPYLQHDNNYCMLASRANFLEYKHMKYFALNEKATLIRGRCPMSLEGQCAPHLLEKDDGNKSSRSVGDAQQNNYGYQAYQQSYPMSYAKNYYQSAYNKKIPSQQSYQQQPSYGSYDQPKQHSYGGYRQQALSYGGYDQPKQHSYGGYQQQALSYGGYDQPKQHSYGGYGPVQHYEQSQPQSNGYGQPQSYRSGRHIMKLLPLIHGVNSFYASSLDVTEQCGPVPETCPVCKDTTDGLEEKVCEYENIFDTKLIEKEDKTALTLAVRKVVRGKDSLKNKNFLINKKCLEACPQLDNENGFLVLAKTGALKKDNKCVAFDNNLMILPSTYMNKFDTKSLIKKHKCEAADSITIEATL